MNKKVVVIVYEYFYPGFKAGGPIQSLVNLVTTLHDDYVFKVITTAYDLNETLPYTGVITNSWNTIVLQGNKEVTVWYSAKKNIGLSEMHVVLKEANADVIFIGGLFTTWSYLPLLLKRKNKLENSSLIVSPRGMLQSGALATRSLKKKVFLTLFKILNLHKHVTWHATDEQESIDIKNVFGQAANVIMAVNVPKIPLVVNPIRIKQPGKLNMTYFSLVTEKKNLAFVLEALQTVATPVHFDIYGPIKDQEYWDKCTRLMKALNHTVTYCGVINPIDVQQTLSRYDVLILPTKGENFGHAIYEALSAGTPAMISPFTPWGNLQDSDAGNTLPLDEKETWSKMLQKYIDFDQVEFDKRSIGAHRLATSYYTTNDFKSIYFALFK